jgi:hypothetical protein
MRPVPCFVGMTGRFFYFDQVFFEVGRDLAKLKSI